MSLFMSLLEAKHQPCFRSQISRCRGREGELSSVYTAPSQLLGQQLALAVWTLGRGPLLYHSRNEFLEFKAQVTAMHRDEDAPAPSRLSGYNWAMCVESWHRYNTKALGTGWGRGHRPTPRIPRCSLCHRTRG